ncbi:PDZ domain-containing protein [Comamonas aquatilis]|uniref:PDZ domain-containing protein n=1 Tax=Comamonas aquatilis TaxID=1778406 RepID=UPI0039EF386E
MQRKSPSISFCQTLAALAMLGLAASAQAQVKKGFGFCYVQDLTKFKTYASPVFPVSWKPGDELPRSEALATEFLAVVTAVGGTGQKACYPPNESKAVTDSQRAEVKRLGTSTFLQKWQDLAFTPKPWDPEQPPPSGNQTRYFFCSVGDPDLRKGAATSVFPVEVPAANPSAAFALAELYTEEFTRDVLPGLRLSAVYPSCLPFDSMAEAQHARAVHKGVFDGFTLTFVDLSWRPTARLPDAASAGPVQRISTKSVPASAAGKQGPSAAAAPIFADGLGATFDAPTPSLSEALQLGQRKGAMVVNVIPGGAAAAAGLKPLDVILEFAGQAVSGPAELQAIVASTRAGYRAPLQVWRKQALLNISITLSASVQLPVPVAMSASTLSSPARPLPRGLIGVEITKLTPALQQALNTASTDGVMVTSTMPGKAAEESGMRSGDVILQALDQPVRGLNDLAIILGQVPDGQTVMLRILRGGRTLDLPVGPIRSDTPALPAGRTYAFAAKIVPLPIVKRFCYMQVQTTQDFFDKGVRSNVFELDADESEKTALRVMTAFIARANEAEQARWDSPARIYCEASNCSGMSTQRHHMMTSFCSADRQQADETLIASERGKLLPRIEFNPK